MTRGPLEEQPRGVKQRMASQSVVSVFFGGVDR